MPEAIAHRPASQATNEHPPPIILALIGFGFGCSLSPESGLVEALKLLINFVVVPAYIVITGTYLCLLSRAHEKLHKEEELRRKKAEKTSETQKDGAKSSEINPEQQQQQQQPPRQGPRNLSGKFKLKRNEYLDEFLEVQGVPWAMRRAAISARPVHIVTHTINQGNHNGNDSEHDSLRIKVTGIISGDTTYAIGSGEPTETRIRDRIFHDSITYLADGNGVRVVKKLISGYDPYMIEVTRKLNEDGSELIIRTRAVFEDGRESPWALQMFDRIE